MDCLLFPASCRACSSRLADGASELYSKTTGLSQDWAGSRSLERRDGDLKMSSFRAAESLAQVWVKGQVSVEAPLPGSPQAGKAALWVCSDTATASLLVIAPSCPSGGCAMNVLLLLMFVKPCGHWPVLASCPPHLSFCPVCSSPYPCVHLPTSRLDFVPTGGFTIPRF